MWFLDFKMKCSLGEPRPELDENEESPELDSDPEYIRAKRFY